MEFSPSEIVFVKHALQNCLLNSTVQCEVVRETLIVLDSGCSCSLTTEQLNWIHIALERQLLSCEDYKTCHDLWIRVHGKLNMNFVQDWIPEEQQVEGHPHSEPMIFDDGDDDKFGYYLCIQFVFMIMMINLHLFEFTVGLSMLVHQDQCVSGVRNVLNVGAWMFVEFWISLLWWCSRTLCYAILGVSYFTWTIIGVWLWERVSCDSGIWGIGYQFTFQFSLVANVVVLGIVLFTKLRS